jgi:hypothetical protein
MVCQFLNIMECPPATYVAGARRPRRGGGRFKNIGLWGPFHLKTPLVEHTMRVAANEILKLDLPAKRHS